MQAAITLKGKQFAEEIGIPKAYSCYEELLADESIDAVYIPLPNHLHMVYMSPAFGGKGFTVTTKEGSRVV